MSKEKLYKVQIKNDNEWQDWYGDIISENEIKDYIQDLNDEPKNLEFRVLEFEQTNIYTVKFKKKVKKVVEYETVVVLDKEGKL